MAARLNIREGSAWSRPPTGRVVVMTTAPGLEKRDRLPPFRQSPGHRAASSIQAPDERDPRNLPVRAFPPTSRPFTHLKPGLLWAFAGGPFLAEVPHTASHPLSSKTPMSSALPTTPRPSLPAVPQALRGPEPAPLSAQGEGQADSQQLPSLKALLGVAAASLALQEARE